MGVSVSVASVYMCIICVLCVWMYTCIQVFEYVWGGESITSYSGESQATLNLDMIIIIIIGAVQIVIVVHSVLQFYICTRYDEWNKLSVAAINYCWSTFR